MSSLRLAAALLVFSMVAGSAYAQTNIALVKLYRAQLDRLFANHGCYNTQLGVCTLPLENNNQPDCSTLKGVGQCLFDKCPDIKGTGDAQLAAEILVKIAKEIYNCVLINGALMTLCSPIISAAYAVVAN